MKDLKLALRSLCRSPGFTLAAVLTLALGIGATTAVFTLVRGVLLQPLPYEEPDRLVRFWSTWNQFPRGSISEPEYFDYLEQNQVFEHVALFHGRHMNLARHDGDPQRVVVARVTGQFFPLLRAPAHLGRTLSPEDDLPGAEAVAVTSFGFWQNSLGGAENALGSTLDLEGELHTIIGVMPDGFAYPNEQTDLWRATRLNPAELHNRGAHNYDGIARLKDFVSLGQAQVDMSTIAARLQELYPDNYPDGSGWGLILIPLFEHTVGSARPALLVLLGAVGFVLLIACANVANLTLVRATARERELTLRAVLGAGRGRIIGGLLVESAIVATLGLLAGLAVAYGGLRALLALGPEAVPRLQETDMDTSVLAFSVLVSVLTIIFFGLGPALRVSRTSHVVRESGRASAGPSSSRVRSVLVVVQVATAVLLLIGAGLLVRSFRELMRIEPGFRPDNVLAMSVSLGRDRYPESEHRVTFFREATQQLASLRDVIYAGATTNPPLSGWSNDNYIEVEGYVPPAGYVTEQARGVTPDYFAAMGIALLQGEVFTGLETSESPPVVVNEAFVKKFWDGESPIGKRMRMGDDRPWMSVIGVVGDVRHDALSEPIRPTYYLPHVALPWNAMTIVVRARGEPERIVASAREAIARVDRAQPVYNTRLYEQFVADSVAAPRFNLLLLVVFALVAVALAAIGIYGVLAYTVGKRTQEIGIRMALGARARDVPWLVLRQGVTLIAVGLAVGFAAAAALARVMESLLFGVGARDPFTFAAVAVILTTVALFACYLPARRAARVDPMVSLRYE